MFWKGAQPDAEQIKEISTREKVSEQMAAMLLRRGLYCHEEIDSFLHPNRDMLHDPMLLPDMEQAVNRIRRALAERETICIYGDYDADGICATVILYSFLKGLNANVRYYIPSRHREGYGLNREAVQQIAQQGTNLLITVDNGISAKAEVALASSLHMDVIVSDHHECPPELPRCIAVIDAKRPDSQYPYGNLCGAGIAFKLVQALQNGQIPEQYLAPVALATMADVVPLRDENRVLLSLGMHQLVQWPGLQTLLEVANVHAERVTDETLAFILGPRLNAAGRMGDASRGVKLLLADSRQTALSLAKELNAENNRRKDTENRILREIEVSLQRYDFIAHRSLLLVGDGWNPGVIGIIAARLVEKYHLPAIVFSKVDGLLHGSGRSIPGVSLYEMLQRVKEHFEKFGGHAQAAGITMREEAFDAFCAAFERELHTLPGQLFWPQQWYEDELPVRQADLAFCKELELLAPFGEENPQPVFFSPDVTLTQLRYLGEENRHLRATVNQGEAKAPLVAFGQGANLGVWETGKWDILYTLKINEFRGNQTPQMMFRAIEPHKQPSGILEEYDVRKFYDAFFRNIMYNKAEYREIPRSADGELFLDKYLREDFQGTLILCTTPYGALHLMQQLRSLQLTDYVRFCDHAVPKEGPYYNSVLMAPVWEQFSPIPWRHVLLYDLLPEEGVPEPLLAIADAVVGTEEGGKAQTAFFSVLQPEREEMAKCYRILSRLCSDAPEGIRRTLLLSRAQTYVGYEAAAVALRIFAELNFFEWNAERDTVCRIPQHTARSLSESRTFARMTDLAGHEKGEAL